MEMSRVGKGRWLGKQGIVRKIREERRLQKEVMRNNAKGSRHTDSEENEEQVMEMRVVGKGK